MSTVHSVEEYRNNDSSYSEYGMSTVLQVDEYINNDFEKNNGEHITIIHNCIISHKIHNHNILFECLMIPIRIFKYIGLACCSLRGT